MGKHTEGPWTVQEPGFDCPVPAVCSSTGMVAVLYGKKGEELHNARLIAAAPRLLEAVLKLRACPAMNMDDLEPADHEAMDFALAVLREVEGTTSTTGSAS